MRKVQGTMKIDYNQATPTWEDSHRYGPAPRWRRRLLIQIIKKLEVQSACDIGCAQPFLMLDMHKLGLHVSGCDISKPVIKANAKAYPFMDFFVCDLNKPIKHTGQTYDLITCSEVLEHLQDYHMALQNICTMSSKYVLLTVPSGKRYPIDKKVGHLRHYEPDMLLKPLKQHGFVPVKVIKTGFPFHSLYKRLINLGGGTKMAEKYSASRYGTLQKLFAGCIYLLFYLNIPWGGVQLIILAKKGGKG